MYSTVTFSQFLPGEFVKFAFPELFSMLPLHEYFSYEFLEVLFLVAPILHDAWLALFETFPIQG